MAKVAKGAVKEVAAKGSEIVTKTVKMPLMVTMTGTKASLASEGEALMAKLAGELPLSVRLGRGRKEVITISAKQ